MKVFLKKAVYILGIILCILVILMTIFCFPDIILFLRKWMGNNSYLGKMVNSTIKDNEYIEMMLTIISCCLTGILGFFTYKLTKAAEDIKAENRKAKQALSAYKLLLNIKHNSYIIYKYYRNLGTLQGLQCNINLVEDWLNLYYAKIIDEEEKNFFMAHNSYVRNLYDSDENNDGTRSKDLAQKYYSAYLTQDEGVFEFNKNVKNIIQKLESISEGEIVNVPETK